MPHTTRRDISQALRNVTIRYPEKILVEDQLLIDLRIYLGGTTCALRQNSNGVQLHAANH